jgi:hypothetical protein
VMVLSIIIIKQALSRCCANVDPFSESPFSAVCSFPPASKTTTIYYGGCCVASIRKLARKTAVKRIVKPSTPLIVAHITHEHTRAPSFFYLTFACNLLLRGKGMLCYLVGAYQRCHARYWCWRDLGRSTDGQTDLNSPLINSRPFFPMNPWIPHCSQPASQLLPTFGKFPSLHFTLNLFRIAYRSPPIASAQLAFSIYNIDDCAVPS